MVYSTYLGGSNYDEVHGIAIDSSGNAYVTGQTGSRDFPTANPLQASNGGGSFDVFVAKISQVPPAPSVSFSPTSLTSGPQNVNATSPSQMQALTNSGTATLDNILVVVEGTNLGDFNKNPDSCTGAALEPGSSCTVTVTFTPSAAGPHSATLNFTDNASNSPQTVPLNGTGTGPEASVSTPSLTISNQSQGTTSAPQPVILRNMGNAPLTITSDAMSANFGQTNTCGGSLAADGECTINVIFAPTATGTLAGTLTITDNSNGAAGSTQTVALLGTGTAPMAAGVVSPAALAFGNQGVDIPSTPHPVTLQNVSSISLSITSISVIGANPGNFSLGGTCGATLAAETTCQINVIFDPTAAGRRRV